jgi:hypothetical protein
MDAFEILGSLLGGGKSQSGGGLGGKILKDLVNAGSRTPSQPPAKPAPSDTTTASGRAPGNRSGNLRSGNLDQRARELEDLLGVAQGRNPTQGSATPTVASGQSRYQAPPPPSRSRYQQPVPPAAPTGGRAPHAIERGPIAPESSLSPNDEALVLVRAMINAAKADGKISAAEQQSILERIANPSQETIEFLRSEFNAPLNVRDFAWSVPLGMEQQVYTLSLAAIELDSQLEASYLRDLAHGLRLDQETCNEIHGRYGAPALY